MHGKIYCVFYQCTIGITSVPRESMRGAPLVSMRPPYAPSPAFSVARIVLCASAAQHHHLEQPPASPLPEALAALPCEPGALPRHLAIIMDGNARWARARQLPAIAGHRAGVSALRAVVSSCRSLPAVETLTVYAFSEECVRRHASTRSCMASTCAHANACLRVHIVVNHAGTGPGRPPRSSS